MALVNDRVQNAGTARAQVNALAFTTEAEAIAGAVARAKEDLDAS